MNENVLAFFEFIEERHQIWHKRFALQQEAPWTEDPILQKYKFCNVYRDLDRGTEWIVKEISETITPDVLGKQNAIFMDITYRLLNNAEFFVEHQALGDLHGYSQAVSGQEVDDNPLEQALRQFKADHGHVFNTAYTAFKTLNNATGLKDTIKSYCAVVHYVYKNIEDITTRVVKAQTAEESCKSLESIPGIGPFLAYEIWCDLILLKVHKWNENDYVNVGPGAVAGLEIIFGGEYALGKMANRDYANMCLKLKYTQDEYLGADYPGKELSLRSIEHSLCEYRKYTHLKQGKGRPRIYKYHNQDTLC